MHTPLTTREGFPRADIDIAQGSFPSRGILLRHADSREYERLDPK